MQDKEISSDYVITNLYESLLLDDPFGTDLNVESLEKDAIKPSIAHQSVVQDREH